MAKQLATQVQRANSTELTRLTSSEFNRLTSAQHFTNEMRFSYYNHAVLMEALATGRAVDLADLPKQPRKSALIIGSGPTLDEALPLLKDWEGEIVCSTSHAPTLIYHGREPEHIMALDPNSHPGEFAADRWDGRNCTLHVHPGVNPDLIKWWKGKFCLFRKLQPQTPYYANEQAIGYSTLGPKERGFLWDGSKGELLVKGQIPMLACAPAAQISIAKHIGYAQQVLVGCDFSFAKDKGRFSAWNYDGSKWIETPSMSWETQLSESDTVVETEFNGLKSSAMQIFYSHQVVIAWRITEANIVNASTTGLLRVFPIVPIDEVIRSGNKGVKGFTLPQIRNAAEKYLARQNVYFVCIGKGIMPHEFKDPLHDIPLMLTQIKAALTQQGRGDELDVDANMRRIKKLFKEMAGG